MTPPELQRLKELCEKATKGPWECQSQYARSSVPISCVTEHGTVGFILYGMCQCVSPSGGGWKWGKQEDADFIALSREALPKLLAEREVMREALEEIYGELCNIPERVYAKLGTSTAWDARVKHAADLALKTLEKTNQ